MTDEIINELWRIKDDIAREHRYDLDRLAADLRSKEQIQHGPTVLKPRLGDLAVILFGTVAGIELDLSRHSPHEALELG
ncbi:MAG: hypothetical protein IPL99_12045 [Candidatus Competibacteraceae bacterium]|nr:hypothetical protein [Candidatus Competibacteraceae bacterium]